MTETAAKTNQLTTVADAVRWGRRRLATASLCFGHGTDNAEDESAAVVLAALRLGQRLNTHDLDRHLTTAERQKIVTLIEQRISTKKPMSYLTQQAWFAGLEFFVDERVLVPRSPIAELIDQGFAPWIDPDHVRQVLDLCTGSGCIATACAIAFPEATVTATDISRSALEVAQVNVRRHEVENRVELIQSDLFAAIAPARYDVVVCNPPYVSDAEYASLPAEFRSEPVVGLRAGPDGLGVVREILAGATPFLSHRGILVVEVGATAGLLVRKFPKVPFTWPEFERGSGGVFILTVDELNNYAREFGERSGNQV